MSHGSYESGIGRRDILCSGGSALFSSLIAALLGGAKPARAQTISGSVPEVDRATVRVVTDNYHFALSPSGKIGDVLVERIGFPLSDKPPEKVLLSEFGLSMHLETQRGNETRNVLIDFGYSSPTLLNNLDILGIDPAKLDALVLSHGHYDHFGGMVGFLAATQGKRKPKLPLYIGGEECFCSRQFTAGPTPLNFGALDRKAIAEADLSVIAAEGPAVIADHAFVTGHIPTGDIRTGAVANADEGRNRQRSRVLPRQDASGPPPDRLGSGPVRPRDFDLRQRQGTRAGGHDLLWAPRRGKLSKASDGGVGCTKGPCGGRRLSSGTTQGGLSPPDYEGTGRSRCRLHRSDALHGRTILRDAQGGTAEEGDPVIHRHQTRVRRLIPYQEEDTRRPVTGKKAS